MAGPFPNSRTLLWHRYWDIRVSRFPRIVFFAIFALHPPPLNPIVFGVNDRVVFKSRTWPWIYASLQFWEHVSIGRLRWSFGLQYHGLMTISLTLKTPLLLTAWIIFHTFSQGTFLNFPIVNCGCFCNQCSSFNSQPEGHVHYSSRHCSQNHEVTKTVSPS